MVLFDVLSYLIIGYNAECKQKFIISLISGFSGLFSIQQYLPLFEKQIFLGMTQGSDFRGLLICYAEG